MKKRRECSITQFFYLILRTLIFIRKMKQLKLLTVAVTLLMGVSLTSCLNSDGDPYSYDGGMVKVKSDYMMTNYYFEMANGVTITPTPASISALTANGFKMEEMVNKIAQIYYRWDSSKLTIATDDKDIKGVELYSIESLDNMVIPTERGADNDSLSKTNNAAIISLESTNGGMEYKPSFYDRTTILLPINYYIAQKRHFLTLVYYSEENIGKPLKLYLSHNSSEDSEVNNSTSYSLTASGYYGLGLFYKTYNLNTVMNDYMLVNGLSEYPTTIEIVTKENQYSDKLDDSQTEEKIYTVTFKKETDK